MLWIRRVVVALVVQGCRVTETVSVRRDLPHLRSDSSDTRVARLYAAKKDSDPRGIQSNNPRLHGGGVVGIMIRKRLVHRYVVKSASSVPYTPREGACGAMPISLGGPPLSLGQPGPDPQPKRDSPFSRIWRSASLKPSAQRAIALASSAMASRRSFVAAASRSS